MNKVLQEPRISTKQRIEIYKSHKSGQTIQELSLEYGIDSEAVEKIIQFHRTPRSLRGLYWKGARTEKEAEQAKASYLKISQRFNNG
jgi:transposase-like protein